MLRNRSNPLELPENAYVWFFDCEFTFIAASQIRRDLQLKQRGFPYGAWNHWRTLVAFKNSCLVAATCFAVIIMLQIEMGSKEKCKSRDHFFGKYIIPSIIDYIDGTHIKYWRAVILQSKWLFQYEWHDCKCNINFNIIYGFIFRFAMVHWKFEQ